MAENDQEISNIEESDIFEWFASDEDLLQDVSEFEKDQSKDVYDYANITGNVCKILNVILFVTILLLGAYVYIQKNESYTNSKLLDPFCNIFLWNVELSDTYCSSISSALVSLNTQLDTKQTSQFKKISDIIGPLYLSTDFINSSEVVFLYDKTRQRLRPLKIISEFDRLKNEFETADKSALSCYDIEISENIMSAKCDTYSSDWDKNIILPDGETQWSIWGTSISIASSFLDYIEKNSSAIRVIDKPKYFSSESVSGENWGYTKKTTFFLKFEYIDSNLAL